MSTGSLVSRLSGLVRELPAGASSTLNPAGAYQGSECSSSQVLTRMAGNRKNVWPSVLGHDVMRTLATRNPEPSTFKDGGRTMSGIHSNDLDSVWSRAGRVATVGWAMVTGALQGARSAARPPEPVRFHVTFEEDEIDGGWTAQCVELPGCVSDGATIDEATTNIIEAISGVLEVRMQAQIDASHITIEPNGSKRSRTVELQLT